jgi:uncharacterized protein YjbJ (UPF0337 family)
MYVNPHRWITRASTASTAANECGVRIEAVESPNKIPKARGLKLDEAPDKILRLVAGRAGLEAVNLDGTGVTRAGLEALAQLPDLRAVSLAGAYALGGRDLDALGALAALEELELGGIHAASWEFLGNLQALRVLVVGTAEDALVARLPGLPALVELSVRGSGVGDAGLAAIARCKRLAALGLRDVRAGAAAYRGLAALTGLRTLIVHKRSSWPADEPEAERSVAIDDACAAAYARLPLETVYLEDCRITDAGAAKLAAIRTIQQLDLVGCAGVTAPAAPPVRTVHPAPVVRERHTKPAASTADAGPRSAEATPGVTRSTKPSKKENAMRGTTDRIKGKAMKAEGRLTGDRARRAQGSMKEAKGEARGMMERAARKVKRAVATAKARVTRARANRKTARKTRR